MTDSLNENDYMTAEVVGSDGELFWEPLSVSSTDIEPAAQIALGLADSGEVNTWSTTGGF